MANSKNKSIKGLTANRVDRLNQYKKFRQKYEVQKKEDKDTNTRREIHDVIVSNINGGMKEEEIFKELYKNEEYLQYKDYFKNWITDAFKKIDKER